ncbi:MAG: DUF2093 domain-containing protein [Alphaproteobacteria bacterium]|nr:DUF2093 domain-containing protein [Alphaproteobacteria bacterium]
MNRLETFFGLKGEATVRYLDGEFQLISAGDFVRCAVTGKPINLDELRYWSVEYQEAYATPEISYGRLLELKARAGR